jgi:hypothetical protein
VRIRSVRSEKSAPNLPRRHELQYMTGDDVRSAITTLDIEAATAPIVPAHPGYFAVWLDLGTVHRSPVVAWRVLTYRVAPVTLEDLPPSYGVLAPDGSVTHQNEDWYANLEAFKQDEIEAAIQRAAARAPA